MTTQSSQPLTPALSSLKRRCILDAALVEFEIGGFNATSMDQVAARAKVSKRTVYNHFSSKQKLFEAIRRDVFGQIGNIVYDYDPGLSLEEQLVAIASRQVEILCSDAMQSFARISIPLSLRCPEMGKATHQEFHASNKVILNWCLAATKDGRLKVGDPEFAAKQFIGLLNAGVFWPSVIGGQPTPTAAIKRTVIQSTVSMFLNEYSAR